MLNNNKFFIEQITKLHDVSKFSLGNPSFTPLKIFLKRNAFDFHQHEIAKTFVLINPEHSMNRVWGYVSLLTSEILLGKHQRPAETPAASKYNSYPSAKVARLAVDKNVQGQGLGQALLDWSINHIQVSVMPHIGCRFLVVDSKPESILFYQKNGFDFFDADNNRIEEYPMMFYDLYKSNLYKKQNKYSDKLSAIVSG